jgi:poly(3-hydroxybutyrate) depolymerase
LSADYADRCARAATAEGHPSAAVFTIPWAGEVYGCAMFHWIKHRIIPAAAVILLCAAGGTTMAAQSVVLPAWVCAHPDGIFSSGLEAGEVTVPHNPSNGSGGLFPSNTSRALHISGLGNGTQTYYLYLPGDYTPARSWPLLIILHGTAPYGSQDYYATAIRNDWITAAGNSHVIIAAPVAHEVFNDMNNQPYAVSWLVPPTFGPNDYDQFAAMLADIESAYNIERTRIYGWGFSAGGHVMHDLGVNNHSSALNASTMAAYSVSAGELAGLACAGLSGPDCDQILNDVPRKIPVDIHIGTSDTNYGYAAADNTRFSADGWSGGQTLFYNTFTGGHTYSVSDLQIAWSNLCANAVVP